MGQKKKQPRDKQGRYRDMGYNRRRVKRRLLTGLFATSALAVSLAAPTALKSVRFGFENTPDLSTAEKLTRSVSVVKEALGMEPERDVALAKKDYGVLPRGQTEALQWAFDALGLYDRQDTGEVIGQSSPNFVAVLDQFIEANRQDMELVSVHRVIETAYTQAFAYQQTLATAQDGLLALGIYFIPKAEHTGETRYLGEGTRKSISIFCDREGLPCDPETPLAPEVVGHIGSLAVERRVRTPLDIQADFYNALYDEAARHGGDPEYMVVKAYHESNFEPWNEKAGRAVGAFQFLPDTFLEECYDHCTAHGYGHIADMIDRKETLIGRDSDGDPLYKFSYHVKGGAEERAFVLGLRKDPDITAAVGAHYDDRCRDAIAKAGYGITPLRMKFCQVLGSTGGPYVTRLVRAGLGEDVAAVHFADAVESSSINARLLRGSLNNVVDRMREKTILDEWEQGYMNRIRRRAAERREHTL